jgi:glycosidase
MAGAAFQRPADLRQLDRQREQNPLWFQSNQVLGGVCYVNLFAGDLAGIRAKIPYFKELGLTYLHLMPLFKMPEEENDDGGYAVSSFREVHPPLGTMDELAQLSRELRDHGISLVLDLVINHTSNEHEWRSKPKPATRITAICTASSPTDRARPLRKKPERNFPDEHPGAFTWFEDIKAWVWTTFHSYQWDLDYSNPVVFNRMSEEMLFLATRASKSFAWTLVPLSGKNWAPPARTCPRRTPFCRVSTLSRAWLPPPSSLNPKPSCTR